MIAVTGATGFVGKALCAELATRGHPFRALSRAEAPGHVAIGEIGPDTSWSSALAGIDTVVHLAARVHVMADTSTDPLTEFRRVNVEGTLNLARQFAAMGGKRLVFVSSIKVNGEGTSPGVPYKASDPQSPVDPYGQSKAEAEAELFALAKATGLEIVVIRPPLVYGPGVRANFAAMVKLVRSAIPSPTASVRNSRSLVYVGNLIDLIITVVSHPSAINNVFLVSDDDDVSTPRLLNEIAAAAGVPSRQFPFPPQVLLFLATAIGKRSVGTRLFGNLQVDIFDTRKVLDWKPPFNFAQGIAATVTQQNFENDVTPTPVQSA